MARYRGPEGKKLRNLGLKSDNPKCASNKRPFPSGQHGQARRKLSEYAIQLREKQRVRKTYNILEKQFRNYYAEAVRQKAVTGTKLLQLLETRFDNVLYRSGLVITRRQSRQLIGHGHFLVNGHKVDIPSYDVKPGDVITVREKSKKLLAQLTELAQNRAPIVPLWMNTDVNSMAIKLMAVPTREDIDQSINENLIIEYYSR